MAVKSLPPARNTWQRRDRRLSLQGAAMAIRKSKRLEPLHPGEALKELLSEAGLTVSALALALRVPANRIGGIVKGQRGITLRHIASVGALF
jgi:hypothetical protein